MSFMKGDYVTCPVEPPDAGLKGPGWVPEMTAVLGKVGIVKEIDPDDTVLVEYPMSGNTYWYRLHWLQPVNAAAQQAQQPVQGWGELTQTEPEPESEPPRKWRMRDFRC